ncbi:hypothetical protein CDAR_248271 [Caerostris darwini]|nr:hypothetical protein CDAR_248271 [Caerostris darwini]
MLTYTDENPENLGRVNRNGISLPKPAASIPLLQSNSSLDSARSFPFYYWGKENVDYTDENPENLGRVNRNGNSLPNLAASRYLCSHQTVHQTAVIDLYPLEKFDFCRFNKGRPESISDHRSNLQKLKTTFVSY